MDVTFIMVLPNNFVNHMDFTSIWKVHHLWIIQKEVTIITNIPSGKLT